MMRKSLLFSMMVTVLVAVGCGVPGDEAQEAKAPAAAPVATLKNNATVTPEIPQALPREESLSPLGGEVQSIECDESARIQSAPDAELTYCSGCVGPGSYRACFADGRCCSFTVVRGSVRTCHASGSGTCSYFGC